jgi:hypothetical protein
LGGAPSRFVLLLLGPLLRFRPGAILGIALRLLLLVNLGLPPLLLLLATVLGLLPLVLGALLLLLSAILGLSPLGLGALARFCGGPVLRTHRVGDAQGQNHSGNHRPEFSIRRHDSPRLLLYHSVLRALFHHAVGGMAADGSSFQELQ